MKVNFAHVTVQYKLQGGDSLVTSLPTDNHCERALIVSAVIANLCIDCCYLLPEMAHMVC